ncbi:biotin--[acetyl-CoA-carboxylase] ligase [Specibacter cremeus]|uniref:biotin--[acetyl-CoA-carboxylase] ligase n=1 Tax=Specibacter cremeus TaxID=1629051 RepID=UPI000F7674CD|nr:biotin--[acetyl-CoA-carboxylase] ligase [Specibacter cremeus]
MEPSFPSLDPAALRHALQAPGGAYNSVRIVAETGSTNEDVAADAAANPQHWPDLSVLVADSQIHGRGRLDRTWLAPAGAAMISSVLLRPGDGFAVDGYAWLSILAGLALREAVTAETGLTPALKWPNDVLLGGRKAAGILAQLIPAQLIPAAPGHPAGAAVVVGCGVNVHQTREQLPVDTATSLVLEGAAGLDRNTLLPAYLDRLAGLYRAFVDVGGDAMAPLAGGASLHQRATAAMVTVGAAVRAELPAGAVLAGRAVGLDARGGLLLTDAAGVKHTVTVGDVVHLRGDTNTGDTNSGDTGGGAAHA